MFDKLYSLVKENFTSEFFAELNVLEENHESLINEASGTIIDGLKAQIDKGKFEDLLVLSNIKALEGNELVNSIVKKYAIRLNSNYGLSLDVTKKVASKLIPQVISKYFLAIKNQGRGTNLGLFALIDKLSGHTIKFETFIGKIPQMNIV